MNFIENYLKILKESGQIVRTCEDEGNTKLPDYKMARDIYLNAFHGLTASGYPHQTKDGIAVIEIGGTKYPSEISASSAIEIAQAKATYEVKQTDKPVFIRHHKTEEEDEDVTDIEDVTLSPEEKETREVEVAGSQEPEEEKETKQPEADLVTEPEESHTQKDPEGEEDTSLANFDAALAESDFDDPNDFETDDQDDFKTDDSDGFRREDRYDFEREKLNTFKKKEPNVSKTRQMDDMEIDMNSLEPTSLEQEEPEEPEEPLVPEPDTKGPEVGLEMFRSDLEEPKETDSKEDDLEKVDSEEVDSVKKPEENLTKEADLREIDKESKVAAPTAKQVRPDEKPSSRPEQLPAHTSEMPDFMHKDDFTFNYDRISVKSADGSVEENVRLLVMPMEIKVDHPEILVCAIINRVSHVTISKDGVANIEVAGYPVEIKGHMDGGVFVTQYSLKQDAIDEGVIIKVQSRHHGLKGHVVLEETDAMIHVLPAGFSNNEDGFASFVYYINLDGEETMGDTSDKKPVIFTYHGQKYRLQAKWKDDILYCHVSEYEDSQYEEDV